MTEIDVRCYAELNDRLPSERRYKAFKHELPESTTVRQALEALGLPAEEVELVLVDGESAALGHRLHGGERLSVFPVFESMDVASVIRLRDRPLRMTRFAAAKNLKRLAAYLRMAGFDVESAGAKGRKPEREGPRVLLTRSRLDLLRPNVTHAVLLHSRSAAKQFAEVVDRLQLGFETAGPPRCPGCNTRASEDQCEGCGRELRPVKLRRLGIKMLARALDAPAT